jgi:uncharacterized protein YfdQ (DUF2303 family)
LETNEAAVGDMVVASMNPAANRVPDHGEGIAAIVDLAAKANATEFVLLSTNGLGAGLPPVVPVLVDQRHGQVKAVRDVVEAYRTGPERRAGTAKVTTLKSFIELVNRHKDAGSAVFAQTAWPQPKFTAVIDYHDEEKAPRPLKHRIDYTFPVTEEFKVWISQNGKPMEQADFAAFLEEHAAELAAPMDAEVSEYERLFKEKFATPAELLELSRHLEVFVGATVKRGERLQTGERTIEFKEEHRNGVGEKIEIPGIFVVNVPAFLDGDPVRIIARLRYRLSAGSVHWFYQLYRWEFWLRDRVQNDLAWVAKETSLPCFEGAPEV